MIDIINAAFENYYGILVAVLIVMVPIWFGKFVIEAAAVLFERRDRDERD